MSEFEVCHDTIPEPLLGLLAALTDEWWGDGHSAEGVSLESAVGEYGYALFQLLIAAYDYLIDPRGPDTKATFEAVQQRVVWLAERKPCTA